MDQPNEELITDLGNTRRLVAVHGRDLRFCKAMGWLVWDGRRWKLDQTGAVVRRAKATVASLFAEATAANTGKQMQRLLNSAVKSQHVSRIKAIVSLAESEKEIATPASSFDSHGFLLNCRNGTLDLRTGILRSHDRDDLITKLAPVQYLPEAECPRWLAFLEEIMDGDHEMVDFLQRAVGYSLTGDVGEQVILFLYGCGANGKSTFLNVLLGMLGEYATQGAPKLLVVGKGERHPTELADLIGRRLVVCTEVGSSERFDEVQLKQLTGGDRVKARFMRRDFFEFDPTHKLILAANHKPAIWGTDEAIWRRIFLVPFTVTIPEDMRDKHLVNKLEAERNGILAWAVRGCLSWQADGLQPPDSVRAASADYRNEEDKLGGFLDSRCVLDARSKCSAADLYKEYVEWCEENGEKPFGQRNFGRSLSARGLLRKKHGSSRRFWWFGIGLTEQVNPTEPISGIGHIARPHKELDGTGVPLGSPLGERPDTDRAPLASTDFTGAAGFRQEETKSSSRQVCVACKSSRFWQSKDGNAICATCHPPAHPGLVARWIEADVE